MTRREFLNGRIVLHPGDCMEVLPTLPEASVDSVVTDPPYHLISIVKRFGGENAAPAQFGKDGAFARASRGFMGKQWDGGDIAFRTEVWSEVLRVLKPGGHLLAFGGTRTYHRLASAVEDAGFEIRDAILWHYGSGFPKSANISKQLDAQEKNYWLNIVNALDSGVEPTILTEWVAFSNRVKSAGLKFARSETATGTNTQRNGSALDPVLLSASPRNSFAHAIIAELSCYAVLPLCAENSVFALEIAESFSSASSALATIVDWSSASQGVTQDTLAFSAPCVASGSHVESMVEITKVAEVLMTWLGSKPSSRQEATNALCAALTDALKRTTLSLSKSFLNLDTSSQTACVSATTATITVSTAESLISNMVATLRQKAIDKSTGAERKVVGKRTDGRYAYLGCDITGGRTVGGASGMKEIGVITTPATDAARQWEGWGTALKPATEIIVMARKPLAERTVAGNVLKYGTGALNVDGCRIGTVKNVPTSPRGVQDRIFGKYGAQTSDMNGHNPNIGRFPANCIHDGSDEVEAAFAAFGPASGQQGATTGREPSSKTKNVYGQFNGRPATQPHGDTGTASRFFYTAKADADDRLGSSHPTVKPLDLIQYLIRLITPKNGVVLDLFAGTGTTGEAAFREGMRAILIEREPEYQADIARRMDLVLSGPEARRHASIRAKSRVESAGPLFDGGAA